MKERPILFKGEMVNAIRENRKTQTRRVIKRMPPLIFYDVSRTAFVWVVDGREHFVRCPYGGPGDLLVPLTTWAVALRWNNHKPTELPPDVPIWSWWDGEPGEGRPLGRRRPGRFLPKFLRHHMPRLPVTEVRVERLQEISGPDALAEGCYESSAYYGISPDNAHRAQFQKGWDSINAKPKPVYQDEKIVSYVSYPWADINEMREHRGKPWKVVGNPGLWVITFEGASQRERSVRWGGDGG